MKQILIGIILAISMSTMLLADTYVNGYYKSNGTYVQGHYRSSPNSTRSELLRCKLLKGTKFQLKVWDYLKKIPRGSVKTYSQVAKGIGKPLAVRAVANAIGKNPYAPKIPCHRVIRSDGSLGGYSGKGGVKTKRLLLRKEGISL